MNVELGILKSGRLMMVSDSPFPAEVMRVEYYKEQRLMMLVYDEPDHEGDLMHYEIPVGMHQSITLSPNVLVVSSQPGLEPLGYDVPLIQVGI